MKKCALLSILMVMILLLVACKSDVSSNIEPESPASITSSSVSSSISQIEDDLQTGGNWPFVGPELSGKRTPRLDKLPEKNFVVSDNLSILYLVEDGSQIVIYDPTVSQAQEVVSCINNFVDYKYFEDSGLSTNGTLLNILLYGCEEAVWHFDTVTEEFDTPDGGTAPFSTTFITVNSRDYIGTEYFIEFVIDLGGMGISEMRVDNETLSGPEEMFTAFRLLEESAPGVM